jgi:uncharacterized membrane protein YgcG
LLLVRCGLQTSPHFLSDLLAPRSSLLAPRSAFTLFELILAIALSATLLVLIGTAINLYLLRVDASRTEVEQSQLARNVLAMIAADIRATTVYQTQDVSAIAQLAASTASINVDDIDKSGAFSASALKSLGTLQKQGTLQANNAQSSSSSSTSSSGAGGSSSSGDSNSSSSSSSGDQSPTDTVPGLNGSQNELVLDVNRLPRTEDLFPPGQRPSATSSSSSSTSAAARPTDVKTVHYFIRQGSTVEGSDIAATSLVSDGQQAGGLVRQTVDQAVRTMAEQGGSSDVLNAGQVLIAPEVVRIEFAYYDATQGQAVETWSMQEQNAMPSAVEVRIWLAPSSTSGSTASSNSGSTPPEGSQMYSETVDLPLAAATAAPKSSSSGDSSSDSSSGGSGSSGSSAASGGGQSPSTGSKSTTSTTPKSSQSTSPLQQMGNPQQPKKR